MSSASLFFENWALQISDSLPFASVIIITVLYFDFHILSCLLISLLFFWIPMYPVILCKFCLFKDNEVGITWEPEAFYHHAGGMASPFQICLKLLIASMAALSTSEKSMHPCLALCQPELYCIFLVYFMAFINFSGCFLLDYLGSCQCLAFFKTVISQSAQNVRSRQPESCKSRTNSWGLWWLT